MYEGYPQPQNQGYTPFHNNYPQFQQNQMPQYPQGQFGQPPIQRYSVPHVTGQAGANNFRMLPNSQCLLLDDTGPIVWLAQTDSSGYLSVTPFTITPYQPNPAPAAAGSLEERVHNIEMKLEEMSNVQPDTANAGKSRRGKPAESAGE